MLTDSISAACNALLAGIVITFRLICLRRMYAFVSVLAPVGVVSPCGFIIVPKCLLYCLSDAVISCLSSVLLFVLYVSRVFMVACTGYMCLYDHAVLWKVGMLVPCGALVIVTRHFSAFLPSLVTRENAPPLSMYHCILPGIRLISVYRELSSQ